MRFPEDWPDFPPPAADWLARTKVLQAECFTDLDGLAPAEKVVEMRNLILGLIAESCEALNEIKGWKWWADGGVFDRAAYLEELVDIGHFLGALAVAVGCDDLEWAEIYAGKSAEVRARQESRAGGRLL